MFFGTWGRGEKFPLILCNYDIENICRSCFRTITNVLFSPASYVSPTRLPSQGRWDIYTPIAFAVTSLSGLKELQLWGCSSSLGWLGILSAMNKTNHKGKKHSWKSSAHPWVCLGLVVFSFHFVLVSGFWCVGWSMVKITGEEVPMATQSGHGIIE